MSLPDRAPLTHLTTSQLAERWGMAVGTLQNMRSARTGPSFLRLGAGGRRIVYPLAAVEAYEASRLVEVDQ